MPEGHFFQRPRVFYARLISVSHKARCDARYANAVARQLLAPTTVMASDASLGRG